MSDYTNTEYFRLADVQYLDGHATVVAADLFEDGVESRVELAPVFKLGVRTRVVRLSSHLLALSQHLTTSSTTTATGHDKKPTCQLTGVQAVEPRGGRHSPLARHYVCDL